MDARNGLPSGERTVKTEILMYVIPIVVVGLMLMAGIIFRYVGSTFEEQLTSSSLKNAQEVANSVSAWLDTRMLETQNAANHPAAKNLKEAPELMNANNVYRLNLMNKIYPGIYDSVSWGRLMAPVCSTARPRPVLRKCTMLIRPGISRP